MLESEVGFSPHRFSWNSERPNGLKWNSSRPTLFFCKLATKYRKTDKLLNNPRKGRPTCTDFHKTRASSI